MGVTSLQLASRQLLSLLLSCLLVFESLPLQALTSIASSDQTLSSSYSLFDGKSVPLTLSSVEGLPSPSGFPVPSYAHSIFHIPHSKFLISGPFGEGTGTDPMLPNPQMPKKQKLTRPQETSNSAGAEGMASSDKATPQGQAAGFISVYSTLGLGAAAALGETWALGYLHVLALASLGVWAALIAIPLAWSLASGSVSGVIDFFSLGKNPLYPKLKAKDSGLALSSYWAVKTLLFLGTLPISLPVYLSLRSKRKARDSKSSLSTTYDLRPNTPSYIDDSRSMEEIRASYKQLKNHYEPLLQEVEALKDRYWALKPDPNPRRMLWDRRVSIEPPDDVDTSYYERLFGPRDKDKGDSSESDPHQEALQRELELKQEIETMRQEMKEFKGKLNAARKELFKGKQAVSLFYHPDNLKDTQKYPQDPNALQRIEDKASPANPKALFTIWVNPQTAKNSETTRGFKAKTTHDGLDIEAPKSSLVTSNEQKALVLYARHHKNRNQPKDNNFTPGLGNTVILNPNNSTRLLIYAHFGHKEVAYDWKGYPKRVTKDKFIAGEDKPESGLLVAEGETIYKGTPLGQIGNTGSVTSTTNQGNSKEGTHLHVGVIELDPQVNKKMGELGEKAEKNGENSNEAKLYSEIHKVFRKILNEKDINERTKKLQDFMFQPAYQEYIYMNPLEAAWFSPGKLQ